MCHVIRADCLLIIEPARAHAVNNGCGRWLISSCACSNLPAEARSARCSTSQALCRLSSFYLLVFLLFWLPITEVCRVFNLIITNSAKHLCAARAFDLCECTHTSMDYAMMLGVPILPGPTFIEVLN